MLISNRRYYNGIYEVKLTNYPPNRRFKVQLVKDPEYHTHIRTLKEAIDLANYAKYKHLPEHGKLDYLISLLRLLPDGEFRHKVVQRINILEKGEVT